MRSPLRRPIARSAAPTRFVSRSSSAYVNVRRSPRSFSVMSATWSRRPSATWRSTALYPRFVSPPTYQRNVGGCQSKTRSHLRNHGSASAASPQKPSGSLVARRFHSSTFGSTFVISASPLSNVFVRSALIALPQLESLDLSRHGLRQLGHELDPAR